MSDKNNEQLIAKLISESKGGKVSRRRFMEGTVAAGVTVAGASSMWSSKVQAATPKRGGTMRVGRSANRKRYARYTNTPIGYPPAPVREPWTA